VLQIAKNSGGYEHLKDFGVKGPLALVCQVMNREARNHRVEKPEYGKRPVEIVFEYGNPMIARKAAAGAFEHSG